jgi:hypothetical protein
MKQKRITRRALLHGSAAATSIVAVIGYGEAHAQTTRRSSWYR